MIPVKKAIEIILKEASALCAETIPLKISFGRVLADDIIARSNLPQANNSQFDGYALNHEDSKIASAHTPATLKVIGSSLAGAPFSGKVPAGSAVKIMTGALIPKGADCIVKKEDATEKNGVVYIRKPVKQLEHIRLAGEDAKVGDTVLKGGKKLSAADIGMLAALQIRTATVYKTPKVAILCTGNELIDIDDVNEIGKVINSNALSLAEQVKEAGGTPVILGIARDDRLELKDALKSALKSAPDFLVTSGGISVGDYDFIKEVLEEIGAENKVFKVAMRPGKPFSFFTCKGVKIFALPGNPVSTLVAFEIFVRPALKKSQGICNIFRRKIFAVLKEDLQKEKGHTFFMRGIIKKGKKGYEVKSTGAQGSGISRSMSLANGLIIGDARKETLKKGELVKVIVIDNFLDDTKTF